MKWYKIFVLSILMLASHVVLAQPDAVTTDGVSTITNNSANVQGTIDLAFLQNSANYFFTYGTASDLSGGSVTTTATESGGFGAILNVNQNITTLNAETQYYYRLSATAGGSTLTGSIENFRTLSNVFTSAIPNFKVRTNGSTNIHLEWTAAPSALSDGYLIIYKAGDTPPDPSNLQQGVNIAGQSIAGATILNVAGGNTNHINITSLVEASAYAFVIVPYNSDGINDETFHYNKTNYSSLSAFTLFEEPSSNAGAASLVRSTPTSITLSFAKSNGAVPANGYFISYRKSSSNPNNPSAIDGTAGTSQLEATNTDGIFTIFSTAATISAEITGLEAATEYSFRILAFSGDPGMDSTSYNYKTNGTTINSLFTLAPPPPTSISNFQKTGADTDQIDFSFNTYSFPDNGGFVMYYQPGALAPDLSGVENAIDPDNQTTAPNFFNWTAADAATSISTDGNINAGAQYTFVILPYNSDGSQEKTIHYRITSPATLTAWSKSANPSAAVSNFVANNATANSFDVTYDGVTADGYIAVYGTSTYDLSTIEDQKSPASQTVANATIVDLGNVSTETITGLVANTEYQVSILPYHMALDAGNPVEDTYNYRIGGAPTVTINTICAAPTNQAAFSTTDKTASTIDLSWADLADADRYLILARAGADPNFTPINGDSYTGDTDFTAAATVGTNNKILFAGAYPSQPLTITNLEANTEYRFFIYAFNDTDNCYNTTTPGSETITTNNPSNNNTLAIVSEASTINATSNDVNGSFITALTFSMTDEGADRVDTHVSSFDITSGAADEFATQGIDWSDIIAEARLINTSTTGNEILSLTISGTGNTLSASIPNNENDVTDEFGYIADGTAITLELQLKLKDNITVTQIDNKNFSFELNPASITTEGTSSGFDTSGGTTITSDATKNQVVVTASEFAFTTEPPATIDAGENISPLPIFEAIDANGNVDVDFSASFTVTNTDNIPMNNAPTAGFINGVHTFPSNFSYQGSGEGTLTISSGIITGTSASVSVRPTISYSTLSNGLNVGELDGGTTNQAVVGVAITALGTTTLNEIALHQDLSISGKIENIRLFRSTNDTFEGVATESSIAATVTVDNGAKTITFDSFTESINTTTKYFFVVVDVVATVNEFDTPDLTLSVDQTDFSYTGSVNNTTYSEAFQYSFNDIIAPEITSIDAEYPVISDSDAGNTFTLSITFNEEMDITQNPTVSFPAESPSTTISLTSSNWSVSNTVFNAVYSVTDINIDVTNIDVKAEGARDKSLNTQTTKTITDVFEIDTKNPTVNISLSNSLLTVSNVSTTLTATFSEAMDPTQIPTFTISGTTNLTKNGAGVWSASNTVYTQPFIHDATPEEKATNAIQVSVAKDINGNTMIAKSSSNFAVDTQPAEITEITSSSLNGLYGPGDLVVIKLTFDDNVFVTGNPKLILNTNGGEAVFTSVSVNQITFNYTVGSVGSGENVSDLNVNSLALNGGTIKDANTNNVITTVPPSPNNLADNSGIAIDTKAAVVTNVSSITANGFYREGEVIQLLITFDENVSVSGNPTLTLALDNAATAIATYISAQSAQELIFEYTVAAGENTDDLQYVSTNALALAGGSILDAADIASNLNLPSAGGANSLSANNDIVIDTKAPELSSDPFKPSIDSLNVSHTSPFKIEFNEKVFGAGKNNVRLVRFEDDQVVKSFDADTLFSNSIVDQLNSKSLGAFIEDTTVYYFEFDAGSVVDRAGNPFTGFAGNSFWRFSSAGPSRIDSYSEGACVGEEFLIEGEYFTGVTKIEIGNGATVTTYNSAEFTVTEGGDSILFIVKANTESGQIQLFKESGKSNNTENFSSISTGDIFVGPSSAQINISPIDICDDGFGGIPDAILFSVDVVGGSGIYSIVYNNGVENVSVDGYNNGAQIELVPPLIGTNTYTLVSVVDNDAVLSSCGVPSGSVGTAVEAIKYKRSIVEAGGAFIDSQTGKSIITVCIAETDRIDFSDLAQVGNFPEIKGDVTTGKWTIVGTSNSSGGFNPAKTQKETTQLQPIYYFSFNDIASDTVTLELTSDPPTGANPCSAASDRVYITFVGSSQANPIASTIDVCTALIEGEETAITQVAAVKGGGATDVEWTRDLSNSTDTFDGTWGFADTETATVFTEKSTSLSPFYKASPSELANNFAKLFVKATAGNCGTSFADSVPLNINIRPLLTPTFSSQAGVNPLEVCSGEESVKFKVNASANNSSFVWRITNSGVDALNQNDKNEITTVVVDSLYGNTITIDFREVSEDIIETITVYEFKNGCYSETLSKNVLIRPSPIAQIISKPPSTINNSTTNSPLIGEGGYGTNLAVGGIFSGKGVVQKSDGTFVLNTTTLDPTDVADSTDDYQIIYTYTTALGCSATDTVKFDVFDQENSFPDLGAVYCEDAAPFEITLDNAVLGQDFEVINIYGPGNSNGVTFIEPDSGNIYRALINPKRLLEDNGGDINITITYATRNISNDNIDLLAGSQRVIINPLPETAAQQLNDSYCTSDQTVFLRRDETLNPNSTFSFSILNPEIPESLNLLVPIPKENPRSFQLDLSVLPAYFNSTDTDSLSLNLEYSYTSDAGCTSSEIISTVIYKLPDVPVIKSDSEDFSNIFTFTVNDGVITDKDTVLLENNTSLKTYWFADDNFFQINDQLDTGDVFSPRIDLNSRSENYFAVRFENGCVSEAQEVIFYRQEPPSFEWNTSVFDEDTPIIFTANDNNISNPDINIVSREWDIINRNGDSLTISEQQQGQIELVYFFEEAGEYTVTYTATTNRGSKITISNNLIVVPRRSSLFDNFNEGLKSWVSTGGNSSWELATPAATSGFKNQNNVWITNASGNYNSQEKSFLYSPAFDLSGIEKPAVSFDLWLQMATGDGVRLEYSFDNSLIENKTWRPLGRELNSGINWYNSNLSIEDIGFAFGWSNTLETDIASSRNARHTLAEIIANDPNDGKEVFFRFNFSSSSNGTNNGMAIDNFSIESLNRVSLVEYFGNNSNSELSNQDLGQMQAFNSTVLNNKDLALINYRVSETDPYFDFTASSVFTRLAFYNAFEAQNDFVLDGTYYENQLLTDNSSIVSNRSLVSSRFNIDLEQEVVNNELIITAKVSTIGEMDIQDTIHLIVAVVSEELEQDGVKQFNVLQQFLPSAQGTLITKEDKGPFSFSYVARSDEGAKNLKTVAFLQRFKTDNAKEVYQAAITESVDQLSYQVTSNLSEVFGEVKLYPNPANQAVTISMDKFKELSSIRIYDLYGKQLKDLEITAGQREYNIDISTFSTGMYSVLLINEKGEQLNMKLAVKH